MNDPELRTYTVRDLKNWLMLCQPAAGLSERVLSPSRAWAIIHNPYVCDTDPVSSVVFVDGEVAAFTAAFPEMIPCPDSASTSRKVWWYTTLYCNPKFQGQGLGLIVDANLAETYGEGNIIDVYGLPETVEIFQMLGNHTAYYPHYVLTDKTITRNTCKSRLAWHWEQVLLSLRGRHRELRHAIAQSAYRLSYLSYVDSQTYAFIAAHRGNDVFLRSQEMFNWILQYPFEQNTPLIGRVPHHNFFHSLSPLYRNLAVRVEVDNQVVGFYLLCQSHSRLSVNYLYYEPQFEQHVFTSIAEHLLTLSCRRFETFCQPLFEFIQPFRLFTRPEIHRKSFSYPTWMDIRPNMTLQAGDGDMFIG